jgi:lipopolysaccharide transport system ATP-binding protein
MSTAIKVENLSKIYRLGEIGTGTISRDMERWFKTRILKQEDPFLKIGETNDRANKGASDIVYSLQDINFEINQGDAVGIIGRNGAGKSTLLKILSRVTTPTTGKINIKGRVASLLEVGTGFHPELTGRENIYLNGAILGMRKREIDRKLDEIIDFSGVERYIDTPVKRYSSGMYVRLAFAVAAHLESEILIVDEVLAVGDAEFQKKCLGKMGEVSKGEGRTVLFVSHNMAAVQSLCGKGIYLIDGEIKVNSSIYDALDSYLLSSNKVTGYYANSSIESNKKNYFSFIEINNENGEITNTIFFSNSIKIRYGCIISDVTRDSQIIISMVDKYNSTVFSVQKDLGLYIEGEIIGEMTIPKSIISPGLYNFKIAIWTKSGFVYDLIEGFNQISIISDNELLSFNPLVEYGMLRINPKWSHDFIKY